MFKILPVAIFLFKASGLSFGQNICFNPVNSYKELATTALFRSAPDTIGRVKQKEISGIARSVKYPNHIWGINDSGNGEVLYLYSAIDAKLRGLFIVKGIFNKDWEDLTLGVTRTGDGVLYIPDFGDNQSKRKVYTIYKIPEPEFSKPEKTINNLFLAAEKIQFTYEDGPKDAESLAFDPLDGNLYIITKRESNVQVYSLSSQSIDSIQVLKAQNTLPITHVVAADFSSDGMKFILKTYSSIYLWTRLAKDETFCDMISRDPEQVNYQLEPQGESICFFGDSFMTLSEERFGIAPILYQYHSKN